MRRDISTKDLCAIICVSLLSYCVGKLNGMREIKSVSNEIRELRKEIKEED